MHQNTPNLNSNIYFNTLGLPWGPKFSTGGGRIFFGVNGHFLWFRWLSYGHKKTMGMVVKKFFDRTQLSPYPTISGGLSLDNDDDDDNADDDDDDNDVDDDDDANGLTIYWGSGG